MEYNKKITEELDDTNDRFLKYIAIVDATELLQNGRAMLSYLFPNVKIQKLTEWYSPFSESKEYANKDVRSKLESICSRFYGDGTLKILYRTLNQIITMPHTEPDKVSHDKDIKKMIKKISIYIQQKLTDSDKELLDGISTAFDSVTQTISDKIESTVMSSMTSAEKETEKEEPQDSETPDDTNSKEEPQPEKKMSEYYKRRLGKKIREMVRSAIIDKKIKSLNNKA